jgi:hypothetical protein
VTDRRDGCPDEWIPAAEARDQRPWDARPEGRYVSDALDAARPAATVDVYPAAQPPDADAEKLVDRELDVPALDESKPPRLRRLP